MPLDDASADLGVTDSALVDGSRRLRQSKLKRFVDILGSAGGLIFLGPFLLLIALLILIDSRGPILFRQRRTGFDGRTFVIYKFRSMRVVEDGDEIQQARRDDCRTTKVGAFLRRTSIDELPQLLNVLKGDMSLVGPRPHAVSHDEYYSTVIVQYRQRFLARPGITGLAQISGCRGETPNVEAMAVRIAHDLTYIREWSFSGDISILMKTMLIGPFDPAAY